MLENAFRKIKSALTPSLNPSQLQWLESALVKVAGSQDLINDLLSYSASARRTIGEKPFTDVNTSLQLENDVSLPLHHWNRTDASRALMILQAALSNPAQTPDIIRNYFQQGDESEIATLIRILILFDDAESYKFFTREVSRTNSKPLFASLAQYNPYPAVYFTEHEFNQLVLKALFMGVAIAPVVGLQQRANPELSQMCKDYIDERVAADRHIPADIWLAYEPFAGPQGEDLILDHLTDESTEQRYYAAKALLQQKPLSPKRLQFLEKLRHNEKDPRIIALLKENNSA